MVSSTGKQIGQYLSQNKPAEICQIIRCERRQEFIRIEAPPIVIPQPSQGVQSNHFADAITQDG
ncbi:hypothetical protein SFPGR_24170 [Sulfuriferula plumbiphila]|nr:hypothetical protein SFPGR_24170 [Sulfuriferula plumbiphila]